MPRLRDPRAGYPALSHRALGRRRTVDRRSRGEVEGKEREGKSRKELCRAKSTSLNQFCPNIESVDVVNGIGRVGEGDNPLFWPFPLQGRPLLDVGSSLEKGGFKLLS